MGESSHGNDLEYLRRHDVAKTLELVTREILCHKPDQPVEAIVKILKDMRIQAKTKKLEDFVGGVPAEMTDVTKGEVDRQVGAIVSLERDESIKSESSTFSINSTDMAEFISDIRDAYHQVSKTRVLNGRVTKNDLGDIIDLIAYPIPEKILCDMFHEVDTDCQGAVDYIECLARMTYRIQGRFHLDTLRPIYQSTLNETTSPTLPRSYLAQTLKRLGISATEDELDTLIRQLVEGGGYPSSGDGAPDDQPTLPVSHVYFPQFVAIVYSVTGHRYNPDE